MKLARVPAEGNCSTYVAGTGMNGEFARLYQKFVTKTRLFSILLCETQKWVRRSVIT